MLQNMFDIGCQPHTDVLNKFDPDSKLMDIIAAEDRHPDRTDGEPRRFPIWDKPLVKVGDLYGRAVEYTRSYGLIEWYEPDRTYRLEWFPASQIERVERKNWHGK
jgi:hypothetical protein